MNDNPFSSLVEVIRCDNKAAIPVNYRFGTVISVEPLIIDVAGTVQDRASLYKNDALKSFEIGERLLLIPIYDEQYYIIVCKVVDL